MSLVKFDESQDTSFQYYIPLTQWWQTYKAETNFTSCKLFGLDYCIWLNILEDKKDHTYVFPYALHMRSFIR